MNRIVAYCAFSIPLLLQQAGAFADNKPLRFLGNRNLAPVVYLADGQPTGVAVDLVRALETTIGRPLTIECMDWAAAQKLVSDGDADALIQINRTEERDKIYDFSKPLLQSQFSIFTQSSTAGIAGIASLRGRRVGVEKGGLPQLLLQRDPLIHLQLIPDFLDGFRRLGNGQLDAVVVDYRIGAYVLAENHIADIRIAGEPIATSESAIAVKKGNKELLAAIDRGLDEIRRNGVYAEVIGKWQPKEGVFLTKEQMARRTQLAVIAVLLLLCLIAAIWTATLYRELQRRRLAEQRWRLSSERLQLATRVASIGIWDWNVVDNELVWDDSMYQLYGIRSGDFGGAYDAWMRTIHPEDKANTDGEIQAALRGEREYAPEFRIIRPDGSIRHIKADSRTIKDRDGKPVRMIGTNIDITERKRAEEELRSYKDQLEETVQRRTAELLLARDAAEAANKAKSVFLANMSHELRTPLNAILGFSSLIRRDPQLSQSQRENVDVINRSGEHLLTLINDVLEIAKIEAGRVQLDTAAFDLGGLVRDVIDMMHLRAKEKGLQLQIDQSSEFPRYINGDEARLRQVFINLVGNAVKFTDEGGVVVRLGVRKNDMLHLLIEVEDSGPGISADDQKRLFKPFVQLAEGGAQKGTGLGLAITRQFVDLMKGSISVDSALGRGSVFRVDLPVEPVAVNSVPKLENVAHGEIVGLAAGEPHYRVLIAEDQPENQMLLSWLMSDIGVEARVADNGAQCVKIFQEWQPDLIWMDRRMPVMEGEEATRRIRNLPGGDKVKIVAVTASAFKEEQQEMLDAGMDDFIRKPYRPDEIYDCFAKLLNVKYRYGALAAAEAAPKPLTAAMLSKLPDPLRQELRTAVTSLDNELIASTLDKVGAVDAETAGTLSRLTEYFDYPAILKALDETDGQPEGT